MLVVSENLVGGSGIEYGEVGAVLRNGLELIRRSAARALASYAREAIAESLGHRFGLGFAGLLGQLGREPFGFRATTLSNSSRRVGSILVIWYPPGFAREPRRTLLPRLSGLWRDALP